MFVMALLVCPSIFMTIEECKQIFYLLKYAGGWKRKKSPKRDENLNSYNFANRRWFFQLLFSQLAYLLF